MRRAVINIAPLLDVLFIILFVIMGKQSQVMEEEISIDRQERAELTQKIDKTKGEVSLLKKDKTTLLSEKDKLKQDLNSLYRRLSQKKKQELLWQEKLQQNKTLWESQKDLLNQEKEKLVQEKKGLEQKIVSLQKDLLSRQKWLERLEEEKAKLEKRLGEGNQKLLELSKAKSSLEEKVRNWEEKYETMVRALSDQEEKLDEDKKILREELAELKKKLELKEKDLEKEIQAQIYLKELLTKEKKRLQERLNELVKENEVLEDDIKKLHQDIKDYQDQITLIEDEKNNLALRLEERTKELAVQEKILRKQLIKKQKELEEKKKELANQEKLLKETILAQQKDLLEKKDKLEKQEKFNEELQEQYERMWRKLQPGKSILKTFQKAEILETNFSIFEITLQKGWMTKVVLPNGKEYKESTKNQEELVLFMENAIPKSVQYDASRSIFLVLREPNALLGHVRMIKAELKKMKVIYGSIALTEDSPF